MIIETVLFLNPHKFFFYAVFGLKHGVFLCDDISQVFYFTVKPVYFGNITGPIAIAAFYVYAHQADVSVIKKNCLIGSISDLLKTYIHTSG